MRGALALTCLGVEESWPLAVWPWSRAFALACFVVKCLRFCASELLPTHAAARLLVPDLVPLTSFYCRAHALAGLGVELLREVTVQLAGALASALGGVEDLCHVVASLWHIRAFAQTRLLVEALELAALWTGVWAIVPISTLSNLKR